MCLCNPDGALIPHPGTLPSLRPPSKVSTAGCGDSLKALLEKVPLPEVSASTSALNQPCSSLPRDVGHTAVRQGSRSWHPLLGPRGQRGLGKVACWSGAQASGTGSPAPFLRVQSSACLFTHLVNVYWFPVTGTTLSARNTISKRERPLAPQGLTVQRG